MGRRRGSAPAVRAGDGPVTRNEGTRRLGLSGVPVRAFVSRKRRYRAVCANRLKPERLMPPVAPPHEFSPRHTYACRYMSLWGIHGLVNEDFLKSGQIVLERPMIGDLLLIGDDRKRIKRRLGLAYPQERPGTIVAWASVLRRF